MKKLRIKKVFTVAAIAGLLSTAPLAALPASAETPGVDSSVLGATELIQQQLDGVEGLDATCKFHASVNDGFTRSSSPLEGGFVGEWGRMSVYIESSGAGRCGTCQAA